MQNNLLAKYLALFIIILAGLTTFAQNKLVTVCGRIMNKAHEGIAYAAVQNGITGVGTSADVKGFYSLKIVLPAKINVFAIGFVSQQKQAQTANGDSVILDFELAPDIAQLKEVEISVSRESEMFKQADNLKDFEIKNNNVWLVYRLRDATNIQVVDLNGQPIAQTSFDFHMYKDSINLTPHGFLYSTHHDSIYFYRLKNNVVAIKSMSEDTYSTFAKNLVAYRSPYYYYAYIDSLATRVNFSYFDKKDSITKVFYRYRNAKTARPNRENEEILLALSVLAPGESDEQGRSSIYAERDTLIKKLGYIPDSIELRQVMMQIYSPQGADYSEIVHSIEQAQWTMRNPGGDPNAIANEEQILHMMISRPATLLRIVGDTTYIFNFDNNSINVFDADNRFVRSQTFGINVNSINYKKKDILVDEATHDCYFKYEKSDKVYLGKINLATGAIAYTLELKYHSLRKLRVCGGYAYFIFDNSGLNAIYKQKLD